MMGTSSFGGFGEGVDGNVGVDVYLGVGVNVGVDVYLVVAVDVGVFFVVAVIVCERIMWSR